MTVHHVLAWQVCMALMLQVLTAVATCWPAARANQMVVNDKYPSHRMTALLPLMPSVAARCTAGVQLLGRDHQPSGPGV